MRVRAPASQVKTMLKAMTRSRPVHVWFAAVVLIAVAGVELGATVTVGVGAMLFALSLVPLAIVLLWPEVKSPTAADVLYGTERRG